MRQGGHGSIGRAGGSRAAALQQRHAARPAAPAGGSTHQPGLAPAAAAVLARGGGSASAERHQIQLAGRDCCEVRRQPPARWLDVLHASTASGSCSVLACQWAGIRSLSKLALSCHPTCRHLQVLARAQCGGPLCNLPTFNALLVYLVAPATPANPRSGPAVRAFLLSRGALLALLAKMAALAAAVKVLACRAVPAWLGRALQCEWVEGLFARWPGLRVM